MARLGKPLAGSHVTLDGLGNLSASDLLSLDGPKFVTSSSKGGARTLAVLISPDKWKTLNHNLPDVNPCKAVQFIVGEQAYLTIPVVRVGLGSTVVQAKEETGIELRTRLRPRAKPNIPTTGFGPGIWEGVADADTIFQEAYAGNLPNPEKE